MKPTVNRGTIAIVHPEGMLHDTSGDNEINELTAELEVLIGRGVTQIIADLNDVTHVSSGGLGPLIHGHNKLATRNGRFALVGLNPRIAHLLVVTKLRLVFEVFTSVDDAIRAFENHKLADRLFIQKHGPVPVLTPIGSLAKEPLITYLEEEIEGITRQEHPLFIVDATNVTCIGNRAINVLNAGTEKCWRRGGDSRVVLPEGQVKHSLMAFKGERPFQVVSTLEEAFAELMT